MRVSKKYCLCQAEHFDELNTSLVEALPVLFKAHFDSAQCDNFDFLDTLGQ